MNQVLNFQAQPPSKIVLQSPHHKNVLPCRPILLYSARFCSAKLNQAHISSKIPSQINFPREFISAAT